VRQFDIRNRREVRGHASLRERRFNDPPGVRPREGE
jgi:hypothetical protein